VTGCEDVKFGVFDHLDNNGRPTNSGLVVRTGSVGDDGTVFWTAPYHLHGEPVRTFEVKSAAQKFADRENAK